jgi:hypothetical protein
MRALTRKCRAAHARGDYADFMRRSRERDRLYLRLAPAAAIAYMDEVKRTPSVCVNAGYERS